MRPSKILQSTGSLYILVVILASTGLGLAMPSCPGQQALEQRVDMVQSSTAQAVQKIGGMDGRLKSLEEDMGKLKEIAQQMTTNLEEQKKAIEEMQGKLDSMGKKGGKPAPKRK